jgi:transcriptional regulator with XRE-family HTH domain
MARYFGDKLRYLRIEHGIVQTELARRLHLATHTHVSQLESHRTTPSLNLVVRVALVFGVAIDYLIRDNLPVEEPVQFGHPKAVIAEVHWLRFGAKVRFQRQRRKLTQLQMAGALALGTQAHISHLESNRKEPSIDLVVRIADLFSVTTDYLLRDDVAVEGIDAQGE